MDVPHVLVTEFEGKGGCEQALDPPEGENRPILKGREEETSLTFV